MLGLVKGNQSTLMDSLMPSGFAHAATAFVESLKINSISEVVRRGRKVVLKHRNAYGEQMAEMANLYFRLAKLSIRYLSDVREWRRRELGCFRMLNGERFRAFSPRVSSVCLDKLPGKSLWDHLRQHTLTRPMLEAAGSEFRRAHQFWSDDFGGLWSHGDASMTNVIYNEKTGRARLIDFEIMHEKSLSATARQADDLLVFLLDMVGAMPSRRWLAFASCFLSAYGDAEVIAELKKQLVIPSGLALIWWNVRTNFAKSATVKRRLTNLSSAVRHLKFYRLSPPARVCQKRRPSMICQVTSAGTPTAKSRTRAIKEIAKAVSPGMPRRLPTKR